jgi:rubredoxin
MSQTISETSDSDKSITWKCTVCKFIFYGDSPPKGCPVCHSPSGEFLPDGKKTQLKYDGEKFDVLIINGSTHRAGNTGYMADIAEKVLLAYGVSYKRYNLNEHAIDNCWC